VRLLRARNPCDESRTSPARNSGRKSGSDARGKRTARADSQKESFSRACLFRRCAINRAIFSNGQECRRHGSFHLSRTTLREHWKPYLTFVPFFFLSIWHMFSNFSPEPPRQRKYFPIQSLEISDDCSDIEYRA